MRLGRRPGERAGRRIDARPAGRSRREAVGQAVPIRIACRSREGERRLLIDGLVGQGRQHRRIIGVAHHHHDVLHVARPAVADADLDEVGGIILQGRRRPGKDPRGRINRRSRGGPRIEAEGQRVGGQVRISGHGRKSQGPGRADALAGYRGQRGRRVDFADRDRDPLAGAQSGRAIVSSPHGDHINARPLGFRRKPGEDPRLRINGRSRRRAGIQAEGNLVAGKVGIRDAGGKAQQGQFINRLGRDRRQHRRRVDLGNRHRKSPGIALRWRAVIRHAHRDRIAAGPLRLGGRPGEQSADRVNAGSRGRARVQAEGQRQSRVGIRRDRRETQQRAFIN